jgi:nucleoside-triphosphatase THEP1
MGVRRGGPVAEAVRLGYKQIVLWTGPRHSGKTTAAAKLAKQAQDQGLAVAGLLAEAFHRDGRLAGFEGVDLGSGRRKVMALPPVEGGSNKAFVVTDEGMRFGRRVLDEAAAGKADVVIVDEFGPLELAGKGWRGAINRLACGFPGTLVLVVRSELAPNVQRLYADRQCRVVDATTPGAVQELLRETR